MPHPDGIAGVAAPAACVTELPEPGAAARAHSERVTAHIRAAIASNAGYLPFSRYMDLALYAPGLGYYAAGATKLGAAGDFVTAPEMTPLFARGARRRRSRPSSR